ncbi:MAG: prolipoprotein diacylglyceryl transferase [Anaerolineae bacterium]
MFPVIRVAGAAIPSGTLAFLIAYLLGLYVGARRARDLGLKGDWVWDAGTYGFLAAILAGRIWYVVVNLDAYRLDWLQVLAPNPGTLALREGAVVGAAVGILYLSRQRVPLVAFADAVAPAAVLAAAVVSLGNLASGSGYGAATDMPWAIQMWNAQRHPTQIYEFLASLAIFFYLIALRGSARGSMGSDRGHAGETALWTVALYAAARVFLEAFRGDVIDAVAGFRPAQVASWLVLMVSIGALYWRREKAEDLASADGRPQPPAKAAG